MLPLRLELALYLLTIMASTLQHTMACLVKYQQSLMQKVSRLSASLTTKVNQREGKSVPSGLSLSSLRSSQFEEAVPGRTSRTRAYGEDVMPFLANITAGAKIPMDIARIVDEYRETVSLPAFPMFTDMLLFRALFCNLVFRIESKC